MAWIPVGALAVKGAEDADGWDAEGGAGDADEGGGADEADDVDDADDADDADGERREGRDDSGGPADAVGQAADASDAPMIDAIVSLGRAAMSRLSPRPGQDPAADVPERVADLLEAWAACGLCDDERLAALSATDVVLLALVAAPALERSIALGYRSLAAPETTMTVGLIADLAGARASTRVRLHRRLGSEQPLRRMEAVLLSTSDEVPTAAAEVAIAPWVVAALYG